MQYVRCHAKAAVDAIRTETFRGREYTVVPVIGLVEGILQGLNAESPEFAPADEFAKFPMGWNGRPVTLNHPRRNGNLVSANEIDMLEEYQFGFLANSQRDDTRLKLEAWIDNALVEEKGDEFKAMLDRATGGEDIIEVSTGLFTEVVDRAGIWNGQRYKKSWAGVVPDHLAFLSEGSTGACSVADGCGAPRLNTSHLRVHSSKEGHDIDVTLNTMTPLNLGVPPQSCCDACARGDPCMPGQSTNQGVPTPTPPPTTPAPTTPTTPPSPAPAPTSPSPAPSNPPPTSPAPAAQEGSSEEAQTTEENSNAQGTTGRGSSRRNQEVGESSESGASERPEESSGQSPDASELPEQITENLEANERAAQVLERIVVNSIDPSISLENARQLAQTALRDHLNGAFVYVCAMTTELCAYERYEDGVGFQTFALNYSIDTNGAVQFTGEPAPVNLLVRIVPREVAAPSANEGASGANQQSEETEMPGENQNPQTPPEETGGDVSANASGAGANSAPRTLEDSLNSLHPDVAAVMREGIELRTQKKNKLVDTIVANSNGVYTKEDLEGREISELEKLETLCRPQPASFNGRVFPKAPGEQRDNQQTVPEAPKAFGRKEVKRGGTVNDDLDARETNAS